MQIMLREDCPNSLIFVSQIRALVSHNPNYRTRIIRLFPYSVHAVRQLASCLFWDIGSETIVNLTNSPFGGRVSCTSVPVSSALGTDHILGGALRRPLHFPGSAKVQVR